MPARAIDPEPRGSAAYSAAAPTWAVAFDFVRCSAVSRGWSIAGTADDAVALLEALTTAKPGFGPAMIVRDPLYTMPLADNAGYRALTSRVEAELRRTNL